MNNQSTKWYRLEPADAWFFRDGKPSNRGEDQSDLESLFPPYPSTVVGAFRAAIAREQGWRGCKRWDQKLNRILGDGFDDLGQLRFFGPLLEKDETLLFPMPAHVLGKVDDKAGDKKVFKPCDWLVPSEKPIACDIGDVHLPQPSGMYKVGNGEKGPGPTNEFFVTKAGMEAILNGNLPDPDHCIHRDKLFVREGRTGIELNAETRTTDDGAMYSPQYIRLHTGVRLVVGISGLPVDWKLPQFLPLGGESRLAACDKIDPPDFPGHSKENNARLVVLVTPAHFAGDKNWWGAGPGDSVQKLSAVFDGEVLSASFDRPVGIGGWDSGNHQPLDLRPYVRPGAVWWVASGAKIDTDQSGLFRIGDRTAYGYGLAFCGKQPSLKTA